MPFEPFEPRDQLAERLKKLDEIRAMGFDPYPHRFDANFTFADVLDRYGERTGPELEAERVPVRIAGRILSLRGHGKAGFAHLGGEGRRLQIYVKLDAVGERGFALYRLLDLGDIIGVSGHLFRTKTGELTVWVEQLQLLAKALLPLPEKWHGLADVDLRYRRRYLDLIANENTRRIFLARAQIIRLLRAFFDERGYVEVETPMMHPILGGATARPFITHHNTLDLDLYLRIAPELYLKRLVVGGLERVYEINRNFRNEGIDAIHQPEFTMLEFYQAYSDYAELMDLSEQLFRSLVERVCGTTRIRYGEIDLDFGQPFARLTMREAVCKFWPTGDAGQAPGVEDLASKEGLLAVLERAKAAANASHDRAPMLDSEERQRLRVLGATLGLIRDNLRDGKDGPGQALAGMFDTIAEPHLVQPTFIYDFPTDISPLSKRRPDDPSLTERFELFIAGMELANGFSELNDPEDQEQRFRAQVARGGDEMPREVDRDYIRALCHGLPPTAGEGIGVDRLVMLLTDSHAIREVILFPLLRPEAAEKRESPGEEP